MDTYRQASEFEKQRLQAAAYGLPVGAPVPEPVDPLRLDRNAARLGLTRQEYIARLLAQKYEPPPPTLPRRLLNGVLWCITMTSLVLLLGCPLIVMGIAAWMEYDTVPTPFVVIDVLTGVLCSAFLAWHVIDHP